MKKYGLAVLAASALVACSTPEESPEVCLALCSSAHAFSIETDLVFSDSELEQHPELLGDGADSSLLERHSSIDVCHETSCRSASHSTGRSRSHWQRIDRNTFRISTYFTGPKLGDRLQIRITTPYGPSTIDERRITAIRTFEETAPESACCPADYSEVTTEALAFRFQDDSAPRREADNVIRP